MSKVRMFLAERLDLFFGGVLVLFMTIFVSLNIKTSYASPGWNISINWSDYNSESSATSYVWNSSTDEYQTVKLTVKYSNANVGDYDIAAGSLYIYIQGPGVGDAYRSEALEGIVGADKASSTSKTRDWSYTYNSTTDTYTFTNNNKIAANSNVDGTFEIVWNLSSRATKNNYSSSIQAVLSRSGVEFVSSNTITYYETREKDTFTVNQSALQIYSPIGLSNDINLDDYIWVKYPFSCDVDRKALGLQDPVYYKIILPEGAILIKPNLNSEYETLSKSESDNIYILNLNLNYEDFDYNLLYNNYVYIAYPKDKYEGTTVTNTVEFYGTYYEDDEESLLATNTKEYNLDDFSFSEYTGNIYSVYKSMPGSYTSEHECSKYTGFLNGSKIGSNLETYFSFDVKINVNYKKKYNLYINDSDLKIKKSDGTWQDLVEGDYEYTYVTIPSNTSIYNDNSVVIQPDVALVDIYVNGSLFDTRYITTKSQTVMLPENTYSLEIRIKNITETFKYSYFYVGLKLHIQDLSDVDITNSIIQNHAIVSLYDNDEIVDNGKTDIYESVHVHKRKNTYRTHAYLSSFSEAKDGFTVIASTTAYFNYQEDETLSETGLYAILPPGLILPEGYSDINDIWDYIRLSGSDKNKILTSEYLASHATPKVIENYKGNGSTYIGFTFDFSDNPIVEPSYIDLVFDAFLPGYNYQLYGNRYYLYSYSVVHDDAEPNNSYSTTDSSDIDFDGDTTEKISYGYTISTASAYAKSGQLAVVKYVRGTSSNGVYGTDKVLEKLGYDYTYRLNVTLGSSKGKNIVITDILESAENSEYKGTFDSIDTSYLDSLKLDYSVSYTSDGTTFVDSIENKNEIKGVKVSINSEVSSTTEFHIDVNMIAPTDQNLIGKIARNSYNLTYTPVDYLTNGELDNVSLDSNITEVELVSLGTIIVNKLDSTNGLALSEAKFKLYDSSDNLVGTYTTNSLGKITIKNIPYGTYTLKEIKAPTGYYLSSDPITIELDDLTKTIEIKDDRILESTIKLFKQNATNKAASVSGAVYGLYTSDGSLINTYTTDENGTITIKNLEWGMYYLQEITAPTYFKLNTDKIEFTINRDNCTETQEFTTTDTQTVSGFVKLTKYAKDVAGNETTDTIKNAAYNLYQSDGALVGQYVTDSNGEIIIGDLALYGSYYFKEVIAPEGYIRDENQINFTITSENLSSDNPVEVTSYNRRKDGRISIYKLDDKDKVLSKVTFNLFKYNDESSKYELIGSYITDSNGSITVNNLEWGDYLLKEAEAREGYVLDKTSYKFTIDSSNAGLIDTSTRFIITNSRKSGSVTLTKTSSNEQLLVSGATYSLYKDDGSLVSSGLVTDENGEINVTGLDWGNYYFEETEPAPNYGLSSEKIRFSVSNLTADITQKLTTADPDASKTIIITKQIKISDINFEHGNPTFTYKIEGTDVNGKKHIYYKQITFTSEYLDEYLLNNQDSEYITLDTILTDLTAGEYTVSELVTNRYEFDSITDVTNGIIDKDTVIFDLNNNDEASATFINNKINQTNLSHSDSVINVIKAERKLTSITVDYAYEGELHHNNASTEIGENEHGPSIDRNDLTVVAIYDDGTEKTLENDEYELSSAAHFENDTISEDGTYAYTIIVTYEENSKVATGYFSILTDEEPDMTKLCGYGLAKTIEENNVNYIKNTDSEQIFISGSDPDNYVYYSGLKWRAISIDPETCEVKMVTNDPITVISYNPTGKVYFDSDGNGNPSYIYQWLNTEFLNNLREPEEYIVMNYDKWNATPTTDETKPAKDYMVTATVGLINKYEFEMTNSSFLRKNYMWLLNSFSSTKINSSMGEADPTSSYAVYPTVVLNSAINEISGTGTSSNPYVLEGELTTNLDSKVKLNTRYSGEFITYGNKTYRIVEKDSQGIKVILSGFLSESTYLLSKQFDAASHKGSIYDQNDADNVAYYLNNTYYNTWYAGLSESEQQMLVKNATWYQGTYNSGSHYNLAKCIDDSCSERVTGVYATIGLPTVGEWFTSAFDSTHVSLTLTIYEKNAWRINAIKTDSILQGYYIYSSGYIRPVIYISNDAYITGGLGTESSPFTLGID